MKTEFNGPKANMASSIFLNLLTQSKIGTHLTNLNLIMYDKFLTNT